MINFLRNEFRATLSTPDAAPAIFRASRYAEARALEARALETAKREREARIARTARNSDEPPTRWERLALNRH